MGVKKKFYRQHGDKKLEERRPKRLSEDVKVDETTVIVTDRLPDDNKALPEVGNGHIATVIKSDTIYMNGLYNGANIKSHRARIPAYINISIDSIQPDPGNLKTQYVLDMKKGMFREILLYDQVRVEIQTYCHREYSRVLVVCVDVERLGSSKEDLVVKLKTNPGLISEDIKFKLIKCVDHVCSMTGETMEPEYPDIKPTIPVSIVYDEILDVVLASDIQGLKVNYFMSCGVSIGETNRSYDKAIKAFEAGTLVEDHVKAWEELWNNGRIDVEGDKNLSTFIYSSLYYLLSSIPSSPDQYNWPFMGMSPTGLAHGVDEDIDYAGHVFWDQDTWMFAPIMLLHSNIGKILVQSRLDKLTTARLLAKYRGLPGAVFPWESAYTGLPTSNCPNCSQYEIHISADVSFALRQYLFLTNDSDFLDHGGADTLVDLATYWAARVTLNPDTKRYEIHDVMGPDEWHFPVNNSTYTNTAARIALESGVTAMIRRGQTPPSKWTDIINNMYIPLDSQHQYHPEYDGYQRGTNVKQADVILLGYPLMDRTLTKELQENDLNYYSQVTPRGPAMTWSMFAINFLEIGNIPLAEKYFTKQCDNIIPPFNVWTENADGSGAVNFHTGMGGYLQSILFGYGGIRIQEDRLNFDPQLLPSVISWNITGLDYGGNSFDMKFDKDNMFITLIKSHHPVAMYLYSSETQEQCFCDKTLCYPRQKAALRLLPVIELV